MFFNTCTGACCIPCILALLTYSQMAAFLSRRPLDRKGRATIGQTDWGPQIDQQNHYSQEQSDFHSLFLKWYCQSTSFCTTHLPSYRLRNHQRGQLACFLLDNLGSGGCEDSTIDLGDGDTTISKTTSPSIPLYFPM